jgi:hypothetical protein
LRISIERGVVVEIDRMAILRAEGLQGRRIDDPVRQAHARAQHRHVAFIIKEIGINHRRRACIGEPSRTVPVLSGRSTQAWSEKPCFFTFSRP